MTKNEKFISWFRSLSRDESAVLAKSLDSFPATKQLFKYISNLKEDKFSVTKAARSIYPVDFKSQSIDKIKRRVHNQMNRLMNLEVKAKSSEIGFNSGSEEEEFLYYKSLVLRDRNPDLYHGLEALLKRCIAKNIFELLPDILYYLSYSYKADQRNQLIRINNDEKLLKVYNDFLLARSYFIKARHLRRAGGFSYTEINLYLLKIKKLSDRNKNWPRFKLIYHFACLMLGRGQGGNRAIAAQRHYQSLERLHTEFSDMPILGYRKNYSIHTKYNLLRFKAYIHYRLLDFQAAYSYLRQAWDMRLIHQDLFQPSSIDDFQEIIIASRFSDRLDEAREMTTLFIQNQHKKKNEIGLAIANSEMVANYLYNFPKIKFSSKEYKELCTQLDKLYDHYAAIKKNRTAGYYRNMKALFCFISKDFDLAKQNYLNENCQAYNAYYDLKSAADVFFNLPYSKSGLNLIELNILLKQVYYKKNLKPETITYYKLLERLSSQVYQLV